MVRADLYRALRRLHLWQGPDRHHDDRRRLQQTANEALRRALREYDDGTNYRARSPRLPQEAISGGRRQGRTRSRAQLDAALDALPSVVRPAAGGVVDFAAGPHPKLKVLLRDHSLGDVSGENLEWASFRANALKRGDIVRVIRRADGFRLDAVPQVQGRARRRWTRGRAESAR